MDNGLCDDAACLPPVARGEERFHHAAVVAYRAAQSAPSASRRGSREGT